VRAARRRAWPAADDTVLPGGRGVKRAGGDAACPAAFRGVDPRQDGL